MKVLFDHLAFNQRYGGVPKYFTEILLQLQKYHDLKIVTSIAISRNADLQRLNINYWNFPNWNFRGSVKLERIIGNMFTSFRLITSDYDIYHPTHYSNFGIKLLKLFRRNKKIVCTVHDMNNWVIPEHYPRKMIFRKRSQEYQMLNCDLIIAVSKNTKGDIIKYYPKLYDKIVVASHGFNNIKAKPFNNLPHKYLLYVGTRNRYKNFEILIKAFSEITNELGDFKLVCVGKPFSRKEIIIHERLGVQSLIRSYQLDNDELSYAYKKASLFVFPSMYEGFGIPCLEAMSNNCRILASDINIFREICGNTIYYFNPNSLTHLVEQLKNLLSKEENKQLQKTKYQKVLDNYSWKKSADIHYYAYKKLLHYE